MKAWNALRHPLAGAGRTKRLILAWLTLVAAPLVLVLAFAFLLNQILDDTVFLASLLVLLGVLKDVFSRLVESHSSRFLAPADAYSGENVEARAAARKRDIKLLQNLSFYSLLVVLATVAFVKAVTAGGAE